MTNLAAPGVNIFSGTKGLGGALTNPTVLAKRKGSIVQDYPVEFRGQRFPDAEAAYHANNGRLAFVAQQVLCVEIVVAKLRLYPRLFREIERRGGLEWLKRCRHRTGARSDEFRRWEGDGLDSAFLCCLAVAYTIESLRLGNAALTTAIASLRKRGEQAAYEVAVDAWDRLIDQAIGLSRDPRVEAVLTADPALAVLIDKHLPA